MEFLLALVIAWGGASWYSSSDDAQRQAMAEQAAAEALRREPVFARGKYIRQEGYVISDLSPAPVLAAGCEQPVLTTDLSTPRSEDAVVEVSIVAVECVQ